MANNWAISVGINHYEFLPNAPLQFAANDALAMQQFLCGDAKFDPDRVLLCGDGLNGSQKATRANLRQILLHKLQHAQNADNLWFFFSGHGMAGADRQDYLMTIDGNPQDLEDTAISIHFVTDRLRACKAKNIVLVLDMCRNESREVGRKSVESVEASLRQLVQDRAGQQGIVTLFSCGRGESSYEIADLGQGAFTYALLEGLRQQTILKDLEAYLARRVPELHQLSGKVRKQVPLIIPEPGWKYEQPILSHYGTVGDVVRLKDLALDAEHDGDLDKAIRLWEQVNLLAIDSGDRRRALKALNRLIMLRAQIPSPQFTSPPPAPKQPPVETLPKSSVIEFTSVKVDVTGTIIAEPKGKADVFVEDLGNGVSLTMVRIPAGELMMGSPTSEKGRSGDESPQHRVKVPEFYMGQTLVTQAQWQQLMGSNPSKFTGDGKLPVEKVSWQDTQEFCQRLSQHSGRAYRLPSEAEWEYACRAGTKTAYYFGETITKELANYGSQREKTTPVGEFPPNLYGLYDLHGNLWEWCLDNWHGNYQGAPNDGSAWLDPKASETAARVLRGGSWGINPGNCRSAVRFFNYPVVRYFNFGFRVVLAARTV